MAMKKKGFLIVFKNNNVTHNCSVLYSQLRLLEVNFIRMYCKIVLGKQKKRADFKFKINILEKQISFNVLGTVNL